MLTVVQLLPALESGGVEQGTLEVAAELVSRGHRSIVISAGGRMVNELVASGSEHIEWAIGKKSLSTLKYIWQLRHLLADRQVDILHVRSRLPAWIAWLAWRGMLKKDRPRFITTVHGQYSVSRYSAVMLRAECIIAVSETIRQYILRNYTHVDPGRITLIPRGVDPQVFPRDYQPDGSWLQSWYDSYPQLKDKKVFVLPGRITRLKGHENFLELISRLKETGIPVHGLIVGEEDARRREYARHIQNQVHALGLDDDVTFTGYRSDMKEIYAVSDIILSLSSKPESFGRTVLEALSIGTPVVGYSHGGVGEILEKIYPQGMVPVNDMDALVKKTVSVIESPGSITSDHPFTLESMLKKTLSLYQQQVEAGPFQYDN